MTRIVVRFPALLPRGASAPVEPRHIVPPLRDIRGIRRPRWRKERHVA
ncbi:MAG: hypothetical protein ACREM3_07735 [Candidatus Rokuibacteriota bacterium]